METTKKEKEVLLRMSILCELMIDTIEVRESLFKVKKPKTKEHQQFLAAMGVILNVAAKTLDLTFQNQDISKSTNFNEIVNSAENIIKTSYNFLERKNKLETLIRKSINKQ